MGLVDVVGTEDRVGNGEDIGDRVAAVEQVDIVDVVDIEDRVGNIL